METGIELVQIHLFPQRALFETNYKTGSEGGKASQNTKSEKSERK